MLQTMVKIIIITVIIQLARGVSSEREGGGKRGRGVHTVDRAAAMCVWWAWQWHSRPAVTRCQHLEGILKKHKKKA